MLIGGTRNVQNEQDHRISYFDKRLLVGAMTVSGLLISVLMRSQCKAALQACPECISLGMPVQCTIADSISLLAISILGTIATVLAYQEAPRLILEV